MSREAKESEFPVLHELYHELFFGHELMDEQAILHLVEHKLLHIFIVLKERTTGEKDTQACGFFVGQFLSEAGLANVVAGKKDGRHFDPEDLVQSIEEAAAIYIGAIGGRTLRDRAFIMAELIKRSHTAPDVRILGRPATPEGKRIATKYGWGPVIGPDGTALEVWEGKKTFE